MIGRSLDIAAALALAAAPSACAKSPAAATDAPLAAAGALATQTAGAVEATTGAASAFDGCTAEDAPAIMIALTAKMPGERDVMIEIAALDAASLPVTIVLSPLRRADPSARPFARAAIDQNGEAFFLDGEITIETAERGARMTGTYRIKLPDGADASGAFDAAWDQRGPAMCG